MRLAMASAHRPDAGQEVRQVHRLDQIVAGALAHAPDLVRLETLAGAHDDRDGAGGIVAGDGAGGLIAIDAGHHHVHQNEVRHLALALGDGLFAAIGGDHAVALLGQELQEGEAFGGRVIDYEDLLDGHGIVPRKGHTGLVCPPRLAQWQVVVVPIYRSDEERGSVMNAADEIVRELRSAQVRVHLDALDDMKPGAKYYEWEARGVPLRLEIGPRDVAAGAVMLARRTGGKKEPV